MPLLALQLTSFIGQRCIKFQSSTDLVHCAQGYGLTETCAGSFISVPDLSVSSYTHSCKKHTCVTRPSTDVWSVVGAHEDS